MIEFNKEYPCRCGFTGEGLHRCHAGRNPLYPGEQCEKEAKPRFIAKLVGLAGVQMKMGAQIACYCEDCYKEAFPLDSTKSSG